MTEGRDSLVRRRRIIEEGAAVAALKPAVVSPATAHLALVGFLEAFEPQRGHDLVRFLFVLLLSYLLFVHDALDHVPEGRLLLAIDRFRLPSLQKSHDFSDQRSRQGRLRFSLVSGNGAGRGTNQLANINSRKFVF